MANEKVEGSLSDALRAAIGDRLSPDATDLLSMCADDIVWEFPFSPENFVDRLDGKKAVIDYLPGLNEKIRIDTLTTLAVHRSADPDTSVLEMKATGLGLKTGEPYDQDYVAVVRTRDGRIVNYKDYWNPLILLKALGEDDSGGS